MSHSASGCHARVSGERPDNILKAGDTCWRRTLSHRFAVIIDAAHYFEVLKSAMIKAERSIFLIGWDFDLRIHLDPMSKSDEWPDKLGDFLNVLVDRKPQLEIRLLKWDLGAVKTLARGATPLILLGWMAKDRIHFRLDHFHPPGACHHQKIVVIDDAFAICGGIDVTVGRWDTRAHLGRDKRRDSPWGFAQDPWHDATAAVDGEAAIALGVLARDRWRLATGEALPPPDPRRDPWPPDLVPNLTKVMVGIARTQPRYHKQTAVHEIEKLYLAAIRSARRVIYIESQ
jgi:phospholipase D1/2